MKMYMISWRDMWVCLASNWSLFNMWPCWICTGFFFFFVFSYKCRGQGVNPMMTGSLGKRNTWKQNRRLINNKRKNHCSRHQIQAGCTQRRKLQIIALDGGFHSRDCVVRWLQLIINRPYCLRSIAPVAWLEIHAFRNDLKYDILSGISGKVWGILSPVTWTERSWLGATWPPLPAESRPLGRRQVHRSQSVEEKRNPISPLFLVHKIGYRGRREAREGERSADWLRGRGFVKRRQEVSETQSAAPQVCDRRESDETEIWKCVR